jgi:hypothetical protein
MRSLRLVFGAFCIKTKDTALAAIERHQAINWQSG